MLRLQGLAQENGVLTLPTVTFPLMVTAKFCGSTAVIVMFPLLIHQLEFPQVVQESEPDTVGGKYNGGGGGSSGPQPGNSSLHTVPQIVQQPMSHGLGG